MLRALRLLYAILLLGIAAFAAVGLMATFEPSDHNVLMWRAGYAAIGVGAIVVALWVLRPRRSQPPIRE